VGGRQDLTQKLLRAARSMRAIQSALTFEKIHTQLSSQLRTALHEFLDVDGLHQAIPSAITIAFSAGRDANDRLPGGHHPAPWSGRFSLPSRQSSPRPSITNFDLFAEPPPLAATCTRRVNRTSRSG